VLKHQNLIALVTLILTCLSVSCVNLPSATSGNVGSISPVAENQTSADAQIVEKSTGLPVPMPAMEPQTEEEAVYSAVFEKEDIVAIKHLFHRDHPVEGIVLLYSTTETTKNLRKDFDVWAKDRFSGISDETIADFLSRNEVASHLSNDLRIGVPYIMDVNYNMIKDRAKTQFITDDEYKRLCGKGLSVTEEERNRMDDKLNEFYVMLRDNYPTLRSVNTVSHVGFNKAHTQALLKMSRYANELDGWGGLVFLNKVDARWIIIEVQISYVS
jgi:hypothetical protein